MWFWTKVAGRGLIQLGVVLLGIVAAKELVADVGDALTDSPQEPELVPPRY